MQPESDRLPFVSTRAIPRLADASLHSHKKHDDLSYILRITPVDSLGKLGIVMSHYGFYNRNNDIHVKLDRMADSCAIVRILAHIQVK